MPHPLVRGLTAALMLALLLPTAAPAAGRAITHEDVWLMRRIAAPAVSPDGRRAVFGVIEPAYDRKEQMSGLWLVATDGNGAPRRLTWSKGSESGVTWSEDGTRIAFSTKREGDSEEQIYVLDLATGGEAQRVTSIALGARSPRFSPDGRSIAFVADVWPGAKDDADNRRLAKERADRKYSVRVYDGFPVRSWDKWLDERQAHLFVQALTPGAPARDLLAGSALVAAAGYGGRREDEGVGLDAVWAPDGRGLVFVASVDHDHAARDFTTTQLWYVATDGGEPVRLTPGGDSWATPRFAADGRTLYAERSRRTGHVYEATGIAALDYAGGRTVPAAPPRDLTAALDRSVTSWGVAANGSLYFLAEDAGLEKVYVAAHGAPARLLAPVPAGVYSGLAVAARAARPVLVARWESAAHPPEVVRIEPAGGHAPLSQFNTARAAELDLQPPEHFWFTSERGRAIHSMLIRPAGFDPKRKYPLLVLIHGGPATMWRDQFVIRWNYHLLARAGYVVLLTDYSGSTGYGEAFARAIERDPLKGPADEINAAADEAIRRYPFVDGTRQCAAGASYGGHLANWMQASTTRYRCLVSHAGLVDLEAQWGTSDAVYHREVMIGGPPWAGDPLWRTQSPIEYAAQFRTPVLLSVGEHDFRVPLNNTLEYWTALQRQQVPSRLLVFPEANHWILRGEDSRYFYQEVAAWLEKYLGPGG
ncbi:MAG TPA: S9 family peptidase [Steroidobacteraceae bacterium]|nr:S9 family peptidase [Steroidobacteraceae bacterium]